MEKWLEWINDEHPKAGSPKARYLADMKVYEDAKTARQARYEELRKTRPDIWLRVFMERRQKEINECVVKRAAKEGAAVELYPRPSSPLPLTQRDPLRGEPLRPAPR